MTLTITQYNQLPHFESIKDDSPAQSFVDVDGNVREMFELFTYYKRRPRRSMVRTTNAFEQNMEIKTEWGETLYLADRMSFLIFDPSEHDQARPINKIGHWPVAADIFATTYKVIYAPYDELSPAEQSLADQGCFAATKNEGTYATLLTDDVYIRGLEHPDDEPPVLVPAGRWLIIGPDGEPYNTTNEKFAELYFVE